MATSTKISQLSTMPSVLALEDLIPIVDDPSGSPSTWRLHLSTLKTFMVSSLQTSAGWISGLTSFAVAGNASSQTISTQVIYVSTVGGLAIATQAQQEAASDTSVIVSPGRQHFNPSAAKAWVNADSAGSIRASYNVTSVTDVATGVINITWATDFSDENYCVVATGSIGTNAVTSVFEREDVRTPGLIQLRRVNSADTLADVTDWMATAFGDHA